MSFVDLIPSSLLIYSFASTVHHRHLLTLFHQSHWFDDVRIITPSMLPPLTNWALYFDICLLWVWGGRGKWLRGWKLERTPMSGNGVINISCICINVDLRFLFPFSYLPVRLKHVSWLVWPTWSAWDFQDTSCHGLPNDRLYQDTCYLWPGFLNFMGCLPQWRAQQSPLKQPYRSMSLLPDLAACLPYDWLVPFT